MHDVGAGVSPIADLDRGEWRAALERYDRGDIPEGVEGDVWAAIVDLYRDRAEDARAIIARLDTAALPAMLRLRARHVRAECEMQLGSVDSAEEIEAVVWREAIQAGELATAAWAAFLWARCALRRGDAREALSRLDRVRPLMMSLGSRFGEGAFVYAEAFALLHLREIARGIERSRRAVEILSECDGLRWESMARNVHGCFLLEVGELDAASAEFDRAERLAASLGTIPDVLHARNNAAKALILRGLYQEAEERLARELADLDLVGRRTATIEMCGLFLAGIAAVLAGRYEAAVEAGDRAAVLAGVVDAGAYEQEAAIVTTWARALRGEVGARSQLQDLAEQAHMLTECGDEAMASAAVAYVLVTQQPASAAKWEQRARRILRRSPSILTEHILSAARARARTAVVSIDEAGRLVVDLTRGPLSLEHVLGEVERQIIAWALARTEGRRAAAARLLGIDRSALYRAWERLTGFKLRKPGRR
jgi:tetratricopeptide (TPR) repeat protein